MVRFLVFGDDVCKPVRVALVEVVPHCMVGAEAFVVFAVRSGAPETIPEMSV